jgi:hypothetical protein
LLADRTTALTVLASVSVIRTAATSASLQGITLTRKLQTNKLIYRTQSCTPANPSGAYHLEGVGQEWARTVAADTNEKLPWS